MDRHTTGVIGKYSRRLTAVDTVVHKDFPNELVGGLAIELTDEELRIPQRDGERLPA